MKALFIVEHEEHGKILSKKLNISFYKGSNTIEERRDVIERIQNGSEKMIITTRIFRRAINIPELQVYINCAGYKSDGMTIQAKGRITRKTETKTKGIYIDFFDFGNKYLEDHSEEREKTMTLNNISQMRINIENLENEIKKFIEA
jgi:superfamily II DNA or RNA helicase